MDTWMHGWMLGGLDVERVQLPQLEVPAPDPPTRYIPWSEAKWKWKQSL